MNTFDFDFDVYGIFSNLDPLEWILQYAVLEGSGAASVVYYITTIIEEQLMTSDGLYLVCNK